MRLRASGIFDYCQFEKYIASNLFSCNQKINKFMFFIGLDEGKENFKFPKSRRFGGQLLHRFSNWVAKFSLGTAVFFL
jgi:hypothetical protein